MTIKPQILKKLKDQKIDERVKLLRRCKFAKLHIILATLSQRIVYLAEEVRKRREKRIRVYRRRLMALRIQLNFRKRVR